MDMPDTLSSKDRRYRKIVERGWDVTTVADATGKVEYVSDSITRVLGYTVHEYLGLRPAELVHPDDLPEAARLAVMRETTQDSGPTLEVRVRHKDGRWVWLEVASVNLLDDPDVAGIVTSARDITERQRAEVTLRRQRDLYNMLSQTNQAIVRRASRQELFSAACRTAVEHGRFLFAWVGLVDADGQVQPSVTYGEDAGYVADVHITADQSQASGRGPTGQVLRTGWHVVSNDFLNDPATARWHAAARRASVRASAAFPIAERGKLVGAISLYAGEPGFFTDDVVATLTELARDVSFALDNFGREADRQRAEEALQESAAELNEAQRLAQVGSWVWDPNTDTATWSDEMYRIMGRDPQLPPLPYAETGRHFTAESWERLRRAAETAVHTGTPYAIEVEVCRPDGTRRWVISRGEAERDTNGRVIRLHGTIQDITERNQAEEALHKAQLRLEEAQARARLGSWEIDPALERGYWSAEMYRIYDRAPVLGVPSFAAFFELVHPEDRVIIRRAYAQSLGTGQPLTVDFRTNPQRGAVRYLSGTFEGVRGAEGKVIRLAGTVQDITERKRAQEALRESQARLASIVDSAMDGIITVDEDDRVLVFNLAAEKMFGYRSEDVIGQGVELLIPERSRIQHFGQIDHRDRATGPLLRMSGRRAGGEEFPIEGSVSRTEVDGRRLFTVIVRDITEQLHAEETRVQLEAQLRQAQKMEAIGTLAGGIAHDFNNILGAIVGNVELAAQDVGASHSAVESLNEIRKASRRAKDLVQRILTFSREQVQPQSVITLAAVVEESAKLLRASLPAEVELATTLEADVPAVLADATQIEQVLLNLCTNAWQALEGQAGRIDIHLDAVTPDGETLDADANLWPGRFARLTVTDTGTGMDAATLERIFEPFFTTKPVGQGTGLGLSVVHGIVKAHGGAITVTSQPGRGSTFTLYFPAAEAAEESALPHHAAAELHAVPGGQHVLYIDDEEALVFLVTRMLERLGYRVSGYTRAAAALAAVRADPSQFDLVVTDLNMPGMSGLEVARELARLRPDLPVVLASGYITEELRALAPEAGVRQLMYKPNTVDELCAVVQRLVGEWKPPEKGTAEDGEDPVG